MAETAHVTAEGIEKIDKQGKRKKERREERDFRPGYYGPDYERRKAALQREVNSMNRKPFSFEAYAKTPEEKKKAKQARNDHNALLRAYGVDPKKQMNLLPSDIKNFNKGNE